MLQNLLVEMEQSGAFYVETGDESISFDTISQFLDEEKCRRQERQSEVSAVQELMEEVYGDLRFCPA